MNCKLVMWIMHLECLNSTRGDVLEPDDGLIKSSTEVWRDKGHILVMWIIHLECLNSTRGDVLEPDDGSIKSSTEVWRDNGHIFSFRISR
jgi:hypothetical protein